MLHLCRAQMVPELGVLSAPAIELLCTAGPGPSTIIWASALVALCSSLEGFVVTHVAFPSWSFIIFPSSSLPSYYFTTTSFFFPVPLPFHVLDNRCRYRISMRSSFWDRDSYLESSACKVKKNMLLFN